MSNYGGSSQVDTGHAKSIQVYIILGSKMKLDKYHTMMNFVRLSIDKNGYPIKTKIQLLSKLNSKLNQKYLE